MLRLVKVSEVAPLLKVTPRSAYRMAKNGLLPGLVKRPGQRLRVNLSVFEAHYTPGGMAATDGPPEAA